MDRERIVGASPDWDKIKHIFYSMDLPITGRYEHNEYISYGVLIIVGKEGLFLQMKNTYEYKCILVGSYTGAKLYHFLSLVTKEERELLLLDPDEQWSRVYPSSTMPREMYRRLLALQRYLPTLLDLIPSGDQMASSYLLTVPKGRIEHGESGEDTALRELHEETGITLDHSALSVCYHDQYVGTDGHIYSTYIYAAYLNDRPKVTLGHEFKGYMWLSTDQHCLLFRQMRILQTFIHYGNVNSIPSTWIKCSHCRWLQQTRQAINHSLIEGTNSCTDQSKVTQAGNHEYPAELNECSYPTRVDTSAVSACSDGDPENQPTPSSCTQRL